MTQQVPSTEPELAGVRNFRDVGGLPTMDGRRVRHGVLFRSGHLAHATASDTAFLTSLGLHTIYDFRNHADQRLEGPDVELPGVRNVNIPLTDPAAGAAFWRMVHEAGPEQLRNLLGDGKAENRMMNIYREIVRDHAADQGKVLRSVAEDGVPVLMHCAAGKDRAGLSVAVTLLAVGVTHETIVADYLKSNDPHRRYRLYRGTETAETMAPEVRDLLSPLFDARTTYLEAAFDEMERLWGSVARYLTDGLGVTDEIRERLREQLLD